MLTDDWSGVDYCGFYQLFGLSFWRHPFTAEDLWVSKWCNATFLNDLWVTTFLENFFFGMNYSFKVHPKMKNLTINGDKDSMKSVVIEAVSHYSA